ncbi:MULTISPECIES: RNA polymerase sigma factor [unclassified Streptomyces]|uniref:RNA polymerase sigma factor n=1 Tax=unclassified Streptomyces TaxID=2593676 RepID=UPI00044AF999|nr:RNA polymerase sigma factor [Streptomyces sp. PCS3-D2]WKV70587.1 RNA polymerase sigma factor [Streptomyces sp. PCS3-D2]
MNARWGPDDDEAEAGDRLLAVRAAEGDEEAFEVLVHRHSPAVLQLAERLMGSRSEAEDAVQDAFVSAWRSLPEYRGEAGFGTWLHRIVTNRCLNLLRARRHAADLDTITEPAAPEHQSSPARAAESHAAVRDLAQAMGALSAEQKVCWVLREIEGQPYETIAHTVGIRPEAARARVFRARRMLTEAMAAWR